MVKWKKISGIIALIAVVITVISATPYSSFEGEIVPFEDSIRLPNSVIPVHYDIQLVTNVHNGTRAISGGVKIHVKILEQTNSITLHSRGLTILLVQLINLSSQNSVPVTRSFDTSKDFLILSTDDTFLLPNEEYSVEIFYNGNLRTDMGGFYRSLYYVTGETEPR